MVEELGLTALLRAQAIARAVLLNANKRAAAGAAAEIVARAGYVGAEEALAGHLRTQQATHTGLCERHIALHAKMERAAACLTEMECKGVLR